MRFDWSGIAPWTALNKIGRLRILKTSYFWLFAVPFLAKLLARVPHEIHMPFRPQPIPIVVGLPFSWQMFYFSAVAFAIASFVFSARCPIVIRDYDRLGDFLDEGRGGRQIVQSLLRITNRPGIGISREEAEGVLGRFVRRFAENAEQSTQYREILYGMTIAPDQVGDAFWFVRGFADGTSPLARALCSMFYSVGFLFLGVVAAQNFFYVLQFVHLPAG